MKNVSQFPDKLKMEGMEMEKAIKKFPGSILRVDKRGVEFVLPVRVGPPALVGGFGERVVVAVEHALWLRDRMEHFRKGEAR